MVNLPDHLRRSLFILCPGISKRVPDSGLPNIKALVYMLLLIILEQIVFFSKTKKIQTYVVSTHWPQRGNSSKQ